MANTKPRCNVGKDDILTAAFTLMAEVGEADFSIRKLAGGLGVDPMTVLHHFGSKDGLLRQIADRSLANVAVPKQTADWRHDLKAVAAAYRNLAHRFPRLFHLQFRYHATGPVDHEASEIVYSAMLRAGLAPGDAAGIGLAFFSFVIGFALAETEGLMRPLTSLDEEEHTNLDPDRFPATKALTGAFKALDANRAFEQAVGAFIAGLGMRTASAEPDATVRGSVVKLPAKRRSRVAN